MSHPTFPNEQAAITKEEAIVLLLAALAMKLSSLSHILNAEGEKLQYMVGTLHNTPLIDHATVTDLMNISISVQSILDATSLTHMLVKNNLKAVLSAPIIAGATGADGAIGETFIFNYDNLHILATIENAFFPKVMAANELNSSGEVLIIPDHGIIYTLLPIAYFGTDMDHTGPLMGSLTINNIVNIGYNFRAFSQTPIALPVRKGDRLQLTMNAFIPRIDEQAIVYSHLTIEGVDVSNIYFLPHKSATIN